MSTTPPPPPPPPPPNDPFPPMGNGDGSDPFANGDAGDPGLTQDAPAVAANPGRMMLVLGVLGLVLAFLLYNIFFSSDEEEDAPPPQRTVVTAPIEPPPLPTAPVNVTPPPSFTPVTIPEPTKVDLIRPEDDSAEQQRRQARLRSDMFVTNNTGGLGGILGEEKPAAATSSDPNAQFEAAVTNANTQAPRVEATRIGDLRRTIAQGRIIQATTESALNTELPAPIRAIVSRDTYGEAGAEPLIPKGSRLIGTYNTDILGGQSRVYVVWTRLIRPDGVDIMLNSPLVDGIGQAGIGGQVDTKFQQIFSRAVMSSIVSIAFAIGSDEITGGGTSSTTNSTFGTTQSGDAASTATVNALNRLGSTTDNFLQRFINVRPTILVDQGTPVNVFINRDLVFPSDMAGTRVIQ